MGRGRWDRPLSVLQSVSAATDLDLISYLKAIPDVRMRLVVNIPARYLLLVAVLGILSKCESLRHLERFARRHHALMTDVLGIGLKRLPSDSRLPILLPAGGCRCRLRRGPVLNHRPDLRSDRRARSVDL
jgi:hypothetical protein